MLLVSHWLVVIVHGRQMYLLFNFLTECEYTWKLVDVEWSDCCWQW